MCVCVCISQVRIEIPFMDAIKGCSRTIHVPDEHGSARAVQVDIPRGVDNGMRLQMQGEGRKGPNNLPRGNLFINVEVSAICCFR